MKIDKDLINRLITESFGDLFRGDYNGLEKIFFPSITNQGPLNQIAKKWFLINGYVGFFEHAGFFKNQDGSSLTLRSKYREAGEKYKSLYFDLLKKQVEIIYVD